MEQQSPLAAGTAWPIPWGAAWVGALTALAVGLIIGLLGYAFGITELAPSRAFAWDEIRPGALVLGIGGAFFSAVAGGWVATRLAGLRRAEPAMVLGGIVWLLAIPLMLGVTAVGGIGLFGAWYGAFGAASPGADPALVEAFRDAAVACAAALLLGLVGSVLGGWMASGEPMSLRAAGRRRLEREERPRRVA